jgi:hypothetical protein
MYVRTNEYVSTPEDYDRLPYEEYRITLQFFHHFKHGNGRLMHTWRYRQELRIQERPVEEHYRVTNRHRFYYRLRCVLTGNHFYRNNTRYAFGANELHMNIGVNDLPVSFSQNRMSLGMGIRVLNSVRIEAMYFDRLRSNRGQLNVFDRAQGMMFGLYIDQITSIGRKDIDPVRFVD